MLARRLALGLAVAFAAAAPSVAAAAPAAHDFIDDAKALLVVGACAEGSAPAGVPAELVTAHCKLLRATQDDYRTNWLALATPFFAEHVPADIPKTVVYPFAGGDLSTALTVFPDADAITTLSLEPAGDPRALGRLAAADLKRALAVVRTELGSLYRSNFSVTMNMIGAMRTGELPTQLIFSLSALAIHGYEPVAMRYFRVEKDGTLRYLTDDDLAANDKLRDVGKRNRAFGSVELEFRKKGATRTQIYRHIQANLDDKHVAAEPGALAYLSGLGTVSAMTKAASYLLTFDEFSTMRKYVIDHVKWMVSDTTGLAPTYGTPAGFSYETYGTFEASNMAAGGPIAPVWRKLYGEQPKRPLAFRFGYPDRKHRGHLIIMRK